MLCLCAGLALGAINARAEPALDSYQALTQPDRLGAITRILEPYRKKMSSSEFDAFSNYVTTCIDEALVRKTWYPQSLKQLAGLCAFLR